MIGRARGARDAHRGRACPALTSDGSAIIELAITLPVLILILFGTIDFGRVFYLSMALTNAARAGAQYGSQDAAHSSDTAGMQAAAVAASPSVDGIVASASRGCACADTTGTTFTPAGSCTSACATGTHMVVTVTVTATKTFTSIVQLPGYPNSLALTRTATLRAP